MQIYTSLPTGAAKWLIENALPAIWLNQVPKVEPVNHDDIYLDKNLAVAASNSPVARRIRPSGIRTEREATDRKETYCNGQDITIEQR